MEEPQENAEMGKEIQGAYFIESIVLLGFNFTDFTESLKIPFTGGPWPFVERKKKTNLSLKCCLKKEIQLFLVCIREKNSENFSTSIGKKLSFFNGIFTYPLKSKKFNKFEPIHFSHLFCCYSRIKTISSYTHVSILRNTVMLVVYFFKWV